MCYRTCSPTLSCFQFICMFAELFVIQVICFSLMTSSLQGQSLPKLFLLDLQDGPASACDGQPAPALHSLQSVNSPYPLTKFLALNTPQGNLVLTVQDEPWRRPAFEKMGLMGAGDPWEGLVGTAAGAANQQPLPHLWGCKMLFFKGICSFQLRMRVQEAQL